MYIFTERCEEIPDLALEDGTRKIFLIWRGRMGGSEDEHL